MVRPRWQDLCDQGAKIRRLESARGVRTDLSLGNPTGWATCRRNARAGLPSPKSIQFIVTTISTMPRISRGDTLTFRLQSMFGATVVVGNGFERADQDDVEPASALQVMQREQEFTRVQPVCAAQIRLAGRSEEASGCADAQRKQSRAAAVTVSKKIVR